MVPPAPADVVVMELPAEHAAQAAEALTSCRLVMGVDRCRSSTAEGPSPSYYATIQWNPAAPSSVRVEVHRERSDGPLVNVREVEFSPEDTLSHRYRAIGLLVVSHVMAEIGRSAAARDAELGETRPTMDASEPKLALTQPPAERSPSAASPDVTPATGASTQSVGFGVDLGGHLGTGPTPGLSRMGAFLRPWVGPFDDMWRPFARLGWLTHSGAVEIDGYEAAVGLGLGFRILPPLSLEVNAQAVIQHLRFRAFDAELGTDRDALTRYGARIGLEGQIIVVDHLGLCFGAEVLAATPPYTVEVKAERLGGDEGPKWGAVLGLRFQR